MREMRGRSAKIRRSGFPQSDCCMLIEEFQRGVEKKDDDGNDDYSDLDRSIQDRVDEIWKTARNDKMPMIEREEAR